LYTAQTEGTLVWQETQTITVIDGIYNVKLGSVAAFTDSVWENAQLWLGIKVGDDAEMTPRVRIVAVPYALRAKVAESVAPGKGRGSLVFCLCNAYN
jgi:hypothetical protein